jgi:hypothetical protein
MISVANMMGSILSTQTFDAIVNGRAELDASQLSRGMYLLQIETASGKQVLKFIKE